MLVRYAIAVTISATIGGMVWASLVDRGVRKERARVETVGKQIAVKTKKAQRAVTEQPDERLLRRWERE